MADGLDERDARIAALGQKLAEVRAAADSSVWKLAGLFGFFFACCAQRADAAFGGGDEVGDFEGGAFGNFGAYGGGHVAEVVRRPLQVTNLNE